MYFPCFTGLKFYAREKRREKKELVIEKKSWKSFVNFRKIFYICLFKYFSYVISNIYQFTF